MVKYQWKDKPNFTPQSMLVNGKKSIEESPFNLYFTIYPRKYYILNEYAFCVDVLPEDDNMLWPKHVRVPFMDKTSAIIWK
jgi:hypothetical protein